MRKLVSLVAATAFLASTMTAFADGAQTASAQPLAPGGAAGVHEAQIWGVPAGLVIAGGVVLVTVGTVLVVTGGHNNSTPTTTGK